jgi:uncharacterized protein YbjT (DUF2867 family)
MNTTTTLVLGGTGKTGRRVIERLTARGVDVRVGSRSAEIPFDWTDRATWPAALAGVRQVYVAYYPDIAIPGSAELVGALARAAREAGVERLVLLSGRGEEEAQATERVVQACGLEWTIVRCSWFNQNFDEGYLIDPILAGEVALPAGDVPEPFVDADDIADVAVAALTENGHIGEVYELTGPRMLTFAEAVAEIAKATGREIAFVPLAHEDYVAALAHADLPADVAWLIGYLFGEVLDGRNSHLTDGVQRALGRQPKDFTDYARDAAARGAWNA